MLIVRDRNRRTGDAILTDLTAPTIKAELMPMLAPNSLLCTDASRSYGAIARDAGIRHKRDRVFHIQNVSAYDGRLKQWMHQFNCVATRYLDSYLGWHRTIERLDATIRSPPHLRSRRALTFLSARWPCSVADLSRSTAAQGSVPRVNAPFAND